MWLSEQTLVEWYICTFMRKCARTHVRMTNSAPRGTPSGSQHVPRHTDQIQDRNHRRHNPVASHLEWRGLPDTLVNVNIMCSGNIDITKIFMLCVWNAYRLVA